MKDADGKPFKVKVRDDKPSRVRVTQTGYNTLVKVLAECQHRAKLDSERIHNLLKKVAQLQEEVETLREMLYESRTEDDRNAPTDQKEKGRVKCRPPYSTKSRVLYTALPMPMAYALANMHMLPVLENRETWLLKPTEAPDSSCWNMLMFARRHPEKFMEKVLDFFREHVGVDKEMLDMLFAPKDNREAKKAIAEKLRRFEQKKKMEVDLQVRRERIVQRIKQRKAEQIKKMEAQRKQRAQLRERKRLMEKERRKGSMKAEVQEEVKQHTDADTKLDELDKLLGTDG